MTLALSALVALVLTGAQENPPKKEEPTSAAERLSGRLPSEPAFHLGRAAAQGLVYFIDLNSGLWITRLGKPVFSGSLPAPPR
jgi:hypothetical protein